MIEYNGVYCSGCGEKYRSIGHYQQEDECMDKHNCERCGETVPEEIATDEFLPTMCPRCVGEVLQDHLKPLVKEYNKLGKKMVEAFEPMMGLQQEDECDE